MTVGKTLRLTGLAVSLALGGCAGLAGEFGAAGDKLAGMTSYERGKVHYNTGRYGLAVRHFRVAVDREPGSVEALNGLAATYDRLGRYDLSARYYERALALDPESSQTLNNIGYSYLLQKRFDLAVAYLREAQSQDETDPVITANRGAAEVAFQEADLKRAAEDAAAPRAASAPAGVGERAAPARVAEAPAAPPARPARDQVRPWIERTAPRVQTLVTRPQTVLAGTAHDVGLEPSLVAYRPKQPEAAELLPEPLAAPLVLDERASAALKGVPRPEVTVLALAPIAPAEHPPLASGEPATAPAAGLVPAEVTAASLKPVAPVQEEPGPGDEAAAGLVPAEVTVASLQPVPPVRQGAQTIAEPGRRPLVELSNGTGRLRMAARIREHLESEGVTVGRLTNADSYTHMETTIFYRDGWRAYAERLARMLPAAIDLADRDGQPADVRVELGGDLLEFDAGLYWAKVGARRARSG